MPLEYTSVKRSIKHSVEVFLGIILANIGDAANVFLLSTFLATLLNEPYLLALIPALAALRGSIATSMASRVTTSLHLGRFKPSIANISRHELVHVTALTLITAIYASFLVSIMASFDFWKLVVAGSLSSILAISILLPITALLAIAGVKYGLNPDNYLASVLTVLGDLTTIPSLLIAGIIVENTIGLVRLEGLLFIYLMLTSVYAILLAYKRHRRILLEGIIALFLVGIIESGTGSLLAGYSERLALIGILPVIPSIMEDVGASLSVIGSRLTTLIHLEGLSSAVKRTPIVLAEVIAGSSAGMIALSVIGYFSTLITGASLEFQEILKIIALDWLISLGAFTPVILSIVWISVKLNLDPDNMTIPLITSLIDVSTIPLVLLITNLVL